MSATAVERVMLSIDRDLLTEVDGYCDAHDRSRSGFVRYALRKALEASRPAGDFESFAPAHSGGLTPPLPVAAGSLQAQSAATAIPETVAQSPLATAAPGSANGLPEPGALHVAHAQRQADAKAAQRAEHDKRRAEAVAATIAGLDQ